MTTPIQRRCSAAALSILASAFAATALGAVSVHIVKTDLKAGIRAGIESPVQFAVLVPQAVSTASGGNWSTAGERATWRYAVQVPTAVSLSFHATRSALPESAVLVVRGAKTTTSYRARDLHRGELWSRIQPGEALEFTLAVAAAERSKVALNIVSLQAGYRSLGAGVNDHPYYRQLKAQMAGASGDATCVTNYECQITAANTPAGSSTAALVIGNLYQCSGTLINDVPGDNTPYILTARHCESGQLGGGNPGAAATVTVYWDATTPCGAALGSIYDPSIPVQTGAKTLVEQQDVWLIELDVNPVVTDVQFAGFDASGGAVQGGYTVHHAEGNDKQFTGWFGSAAAIKQNDVLGTTYLSNFWETVNQTGNIGPGASGSGLFDQNNHLVGALSLGRQTTDPSGYGACPVVPPPAPNGSNGVADFTSLAAVWSSTADTTSSTGSTTLKSVLDPGNSGTVVAGSLPAAVVQFNSLTIDRFIIGTEIQLGWSAPNANQCTATGGVSGDGWSGTVPAVGTVALTETAPTIATYGLSCTFPGGRTARASLTLTWVGPTPQVLFNSPGAVWTSRPAVLSWSSNTSPCSITGGGLSLNNLPASGATTTTQATPGDVTYSITCGPANNNTTVTTTVLYGTPSLLFQANSTDRLAGQPLFLQWFTYADQCTPSGGAPNDGWATNEFDSPNSITQFNPNVTTPGTYTYTLTCSSGPLSVQQSVVVTVENDAPYVTTTIDKSTVTLTDSPADYMTMSWRSNLSLCTPNENPFLAGTITTPIPSDQILPQEAVVFAPTTPGTYVVSVTCTAQLTANTSATSAPITLTVLPAPAPTATISITPSTLPVGQNFTISWSTTNAAACAETGGSPGGIWGAAGPSNFGDPPTGSSVSYSNEAGTYTFGIICLSINSPQQTVSAQTTVTIPQLTATLNANTTSLTTGSPLTLTWSSTGATGCSASGGGANGEAWSGNVQLSGTVTQNATTTGKFTYTITCTAGPADSVMAQANVTVSAPNSGGGGSGGGGGHGGGGALGLLELALLAGMRALRRRGCSASPPSPR